MEMRAIEEQWQIPHDKLLILARSGLFTSVSTKFIIDVDADGNFQQIKSEHTAYKRKREFPV